MFNLKPHDHDVAGAPPLIPDGESGCGKANSWMPIWAVGHPSADRARDVIGRVAEARFRTSDPRPGRTLLQLQEETVLRDYLKRSVGDLRMHMDAEAESVAADDAGVSHLGLHGGFSETAWITQHLLGPATGAEGPSSGVDEGDDPRVAIDQILLEFLQEHTWSAAYSLSSGLAGVGVYFLERAPSDAAFEGIRSVVGHLDRLAESTGAGITWRTRPEHLPSSARQEYPEGYYDLSVPHGVSGVVYFLNEAVACGSANTVAERLLEGTMEWLLAQQDPMPGLSRYFPDWRQLELPVNDN